LVEIVFESLAKVKELVTTILIIEQFVQRVLSMSDRCAILLRGEVA
jgi:ABC-type branched-subunit amino acid transport system ATPase component